MLVLPQDVFNAFEILIFQKDMQIAAPTPRHQNHQLTFFLKSPFGPNKAFFAVVLCQHPKNIHT